ncbi:MAG: thioesterase [Deltaproteobacteria bacterium]|nr:MAG: thioesterase [Deltaproteobacteria bacterium]
MNNQAFQDAYPDDLNHCYGCGRLNSEGLQLRSYWDGDETIARFRPRPSQMVIPGYVYGGLLASLIDCHGVGSASAAAGRQWPEQAPIRFVTASLHVDYLRPTPIDTELEIRGTIREVKEKKVIVSVTVWANGQSCAKGQVVAVRMPASMLKK